MSIFASIMLDPAAIAAWFVIGLAVGWLAGRFMEEASYGPGGDYILGVLGALVGGFAFGFIHDADGFWGSWVVAVIVSSIFVGCGRAFVAMRSE